MKTGMQIWLVAGTLVAGAWCQTPPAPPATPSTPAAPARAPRAVKVRGAQSPYLGVNIDEVTADRASALKLKDARGVEVTLVDADAAAGKAGIKVHDVITNYNGTQVEGEEQLRRLIRETPVGRTVQIMVMRDGNPVNLQATIGAHPSAYNFVWKDSSPLAPMPPMPPINVDIPDFDIPAIEVSRTYAPSTGLVVESLTPQLATYFGAKSGEGVLVRNVEPRSAAEKAGLRAGDVIVRIGDEKIESRSDFRRALRAKSGEVKVVVLRDKREQTLTMAVPEKHSQMRSQEWKFEFPDMSAEMKDLEPEIQLAQADAMKDWAKHQKEWSKEFQREWASHQGEWKREMDKAQKELEKSMKELHESLQHDLMN